MSLNISTSLVSRKRGIETESKKTSNDLMNEVASYIRSECITINDLYRPGDYFPIIMKRPKIYEYLFHIYHPRPPQPQLYALSDFTMEPISDWRKTVLLLGPPDCGRSSFAIANIGKTLKVTDLSDLMHFRPEFHDGILINDPVFIQNMKPMDVLRLLDRSSDYYVYERNKHNVIPSGTKVIMTHYDTDVLRFNDTDVDVQKSVNNRVNKIFCHESLFSSGSVAHGVRATSGGGAAGCKEEF